MFKKIILIFVILCFCLIPFFKPKQNNELVFWTLQMSDFAPYINKLISEFESQNPQVKIKWVDVPFSEGEKRTLASILSDNPPDLVNLNPDFSNILAQKGALEEIDTKNTTQFNQNIINSLKYKGKLYAIPWYATSAITIYNKDLVEKSGLNFLPKAYEDFATIAPTIKEKTGAFAFMPTITENDTMAKILNKYGITDLKDAQEIFDFYKKLYQNNLIPKETITQTHQEALEKYMSEQIVFYQGGANFLNMIKENSPAVYKKTDVAPQIVGKLGQNDFSLMNFIIPLKSKNKENALRFALFINNEENQLELAKLTNILATNQKALNSNFYKNYGNDLADKARVISAKQLSQIEPSFKQSRNQKEINMLINIAVQEVLLNKSKSTSVLITTQKKINKL